MTDAAAETRSVVVEREMAHAPEKIWRALTQPHLMQEWLMQNDFQPTAGHRFNLRRQPRPDVNIVIDCQVLEIEPPRTLSYTWAAQGLDGVVTWTLTPTRGGTHLRMEHSGFPSDRRQAFAGATAGWRQIFAALEQVLTRID